MLEKVSILIKTFLRDQHLFEAVRGIQATMPEVQMIVVDDGEPSNVKSALYTMMRLNGHIIIEMPFDSGFGRKSNAGAGACERPYLLIGSDDFDFSVPSVRYGIELLTRVLECSYANIDVASGRVNSYPYEGWLDDQGERVVESYIKFDNPDTTLDGVVFHMCNLTVNYSLIRKSILGPGGIEWDDDIKIGGGEHGAQFVKIMRAGHRVAYVPGVNICEQQGRPTDVRYQQFRGRARLPGRPAFQKLGIREYVMFGGGVETA